MNTRFRYFRYLHSKDLDDKWSNYLSIHENPTIKWNVPITDVQTIHWVTSRNLRDVYFEILRDKRFYYNIAAFASASDKGHVHLMVSHAYYSSYLSTCVMMDLCHDSLYMEFSECVQNLCWKHMSITFILTTLLCGYVTARSHSIGLFWRPLSLTQF